MSAVPSLSDIAPIQRQILQRLARGVTWDEVAASTSRTMADARAIADDGLTALAGIAPEALETDDRLAVSEYLLDRLRPGEAAAVWLLLDGSEDVEQWAGRIRLALSDVTRDDPAPLPSDPNAVGPTDRLRLSHTNAGRGPAGPTRDLAARREARNRQRTELSAQLAAAELLSPFRSEAIEEQRKADDRVELPEFAPRPVRFAMYAVLLALVVGFAFAIFVRIPVDTTASVMVVEVPSSAPGPDRGIALVVLLPPEPPTDDTRAVRAGDTLRVALPGQDQRQPVRISWVSRGTLSPRQIVDDYRLPLGQANLVQTPSAVAVAPIRVPQGRSPRQYEGTTTAEASVRTGSRRIISLLI